MKRRRQQGNIMAFFVVALTTLIGLGGLTVDAGLLFMHKQLVARAADAATLAAATFLPSDPDEAVAVANDYLTDNGIDASDTVTITTPYQGDASAIAVEIRRTMKPTFTAILGLSTVKAGAFSVGLNTTPAAFQYAVFHGSGTVPMSIAMNNTVVDGNVHSNDSALVAGNNGEYDGRFEAVDLVLNTGSNNDFEERVDGAAPLPMPIYDWDELRSLASVIYSSDHDFGTNNITLDGIMFIDGDATFGGNNISGIGAIIATGDIIISGQTFERTNASTDAVTLMTGGNLRINANSAYVDGIIFAPNGGITFNGNTPTINGAVVGQTVAINRNSTTITYDSSHLKSLPATLRVVRINQVG